MSDRPAGGARRGGSSTASSSRIGVFAVCTPGLESLVADEVRRVGAASVTARHGGVSATATWPQVWQLNLTSRIATRVLVRVAHFDTDGPRTFETGMRRIDWSAWLPAGEPVEVSATSVGSELFHTGLVGEITREVLGAGPAVPEAAEGDTGSALATVVHIRLVRNQVTVSIDSSGEALYRRGWRRDVAKAPLRETLAAALIARSGWDGKAPLVDPFCGSGTIPIEAALVARRIPAGRHRSFAFEQWPSFDATRWARMLAAADADVIDRSPVLIGADRDDGAIAAARANTGRAGLAEGTVEWRQASVSDLTVPPGGRRGAVITNPPYGERIGTDLRDLYDRFGQVLATRCPGWTLALALQAGPLPGRLGVALDTSFATTNGGLPIVLATGTV